MTKTLTEKKFIDFDALTDGIYELPVILSKANIEEIYKFSKVKAHHDEDTHDGGTAKPDKDDEEERKPKLFEANKPYNVPWISDLIYQNIPEITTHRGLHSIGVDSNFQVYTLPEGGGVVPQHIDKDFKVNDSRALYSILIYLNSAYTGGETVFNKNMYAPKVPVGAGILFRHNILHEGLEVISGEKHVLKTDLLFV